MKRRIIAMAIALLTLMSLPLTAQAHVLTGNTSKVDYDNTDPNLYWIEIDLTNQIISVYQTTTGAVMLQSLCTTGGEETPTGAGVYKIGDLKERFGYFVAYGQYAQYWTQVVRGVYIHSVMYDSQKLSSMSKSAYRNLGKAVSHGCVRVLPHVAQWIYYNCPPGTTCKVTSVKPLDEALRSAIKAGIPAYDDYAQPADAKAAVPDVPATVRYNKTPLRTGFSTSKDTTVQNLNAGDNVMLLQIGAEWCKVRTTAGKLGYIKTPYLLFYPDAPVEKTQAYAATKKTYVYEEMDTGSEKLATLAQGTAVTVYENPKTGWYSASFNGVSGYVRTKYVALSETVAYPQLPIVETAPTVAAATGVSEDGAAATTSATQTVTRMDVSVNLRAQPSSAAAVVATLPPATPLHVMSIEGAWYYCSVGMVTGYLHESCLG
ncbi:MAG: SH3 domain-containing protein [Clostridia bacterium]|nr:SH3 domain-containing protein [Clostridia bacterium]